MCGSSKPKPPPPPAPPPPAPEPSAASIQATPRSKADAARDSTARKRKGRSSLRIDLNSAGTTVGNGVNIPRG